MFVNHITKNVIVTQVYKHISSTPTPPPPRNKEESNLTTRYLKALI